MYLNFKHSTAYPDRVVLNHDTVITSVGVNAIELTHPAMYSRKPLVIKVGFETSGERDFFKTRILYLVSEESNFDDKDLEMDISFKND